MPYTIKNRLTSATLYHSETTDNERSAILEAIRSRADLSGADLSRANLSGADLSRAHLYGANLSGADLSRVNLSGANLSGANLSGAHLYGANLSGADLSRVNLSRANLSGADLSRANLSGAHLSGTNLSRAHLSRANLSRADLSRATNASTAIAMTRILPEGSIIGWKKCAAGRIVKLRIPEDAKRSHAFGRKCRAEFAEVLAVFGPKGGAHNTAASGGFSGASITYTVGETVRPDSFNPDFTQECASGIHFFITREEAEAYTL